MAVNTSARATGWVDAAEREGARARQGHDRDLVAARVALEGLARPEDDDARRQVPPADALRAHIEDDARAAAGAQVTHGVRHAGTSAVISSTRTGRPSSQLRLAASARRSVSSASSGPGVGVTPAARSRKNASNSSR